MSNKHVTSKCNVSMVCRVQWRVILWRGFALQIRGWPLLLSSDTLCVLIQGRLLNAGDIHSYGMIIYFKCVLKQGVSSFELCLKIIHGFHSLRALCLNYASKCKYLQGKMYSSICWTFPQYMTNTLTLIPTEHTLFLALPSPVPTQLFI